MVKEMQRFPSVLEAIFREAWLNFYDLSLNFKLPKLLDIPTAEGVCDLFTKSTRIYEDYKIQFVDSLFGKTPRICGVYKFWLVQEKFDCHLYGETARIYEALKLSSVDSLFDIKTRMSKP